MLITFHSKAWSSITLFGDVALTLLKMAGHSGTVPSALRAGDVAPALERLKLSLAAVPEPERPADTHERDEDEGEPPPVGLRLRAFPLIELLSAAAQQKCDVMWETGAPLL